ncbi:hypothetical protein [Segniliparus rugosus]|uniref:YcxB-like protein domain-containing protein n=1 Tax=Segniliparus rugosus (strain ATCC BAA-974 / DSM 45345 / CCUG 50838 / CIP 108380 / JCM 13579 / CDC 945) TaxID=679197 RepID=E5XMY7_SEGRC|nr:hypothetical protein [Segniliparus rugosus]EFV14286.1 hypothetical protein HMPREF9336_00857 [Segniliparus rugosus ATCC BAA-974]
MSVPSDADVPLVRTSFTCTAQTADALARERARQVLSAPARWAVVVLLSLFEGFAFSAWGQSLPSFAAASAISLVLLSALFFGLRYWAVYRSGRRALAANYPSGAVLRAEFGTHGFTTRSPRGVSHVGYGELKSFALHTHSAIYILSHQPLLPLVAPREIFPETALALIRPHVKIRGEA